eukprot:CAMPEP_0204245768 /NCGR_PEP_ID=MMETSP0361-20130328/97800_1 /ASSEMBLY_ACC=CAM_ASM_000343 /TAXON_ID=268821 /ORGANISM="Scrippsiella Hangoei, Strain SHTV-5" /LENGTH=518 /DNA_ID=CAMNT_0051218977 /DNA_START=25 /DNA_END=1581 /DNA_ORIENTATION=+
MDCFGFLRGSTGGGGSARTPLLPGGEAKSGCFSRCFPTKADASAEAHTKAADGLQDIVSGYHKIAQLALPPGAALVFANLRRDIVELEALISEAKFPKNRPWMLPLPEEQEDWEAVYPEGGFLLRRQVCMATTGDEEWFLGGLFVSDVGVVFDTGDAPDDSACFQTGFLPWKRISALERPGPKAELVLKLTAGAQDFNELRLQLSILTDIEWIEEFWKLRSAYASHDMSIPDEHECIHVPGIMKPKLLLPGTGAETALDRSNSILSPSKRVGVADVSTRSNTLLQRKLSRTMSAAMTRMHSEEGSPFTERNHRLMTLEPQLSGVFADAPGGRKGTQMPNEKPLCEEMVQGLTVEQLRVALRRDDSIPKVVVRGRQAQNVAATTWSESKRSPGMFVRKANFVIPLPQDFPKAVTRLVAVPTETSITAVYRLTVQGDQLVLTVQMCSHDVPYGENFRVHETLRFKPLPTGVSVEKWVEIMWVAALPWTHGILKGIIESKTKADAAKDLKNLVTVLQELVR